MEVTTTQSLTCSTCQTDWGKINPSVAWPLNSCPCHEPGCKTRLSMCCMCLGEGKSCLDCGRTFCHQHVRITNTERELGVCAECRRLRLLKANDVSGHEWLQAVVLFLVILVACLFVGKLQNL